MADDWRVPARRELLRLRGAGGAWGYRTGASPAVEPTALASLGLIASAAGPEPGGDAPAVRVAADWLASIQRPDGGLGISAGQAKPCWPTPYGVILWGVLGGYEPQRRRGVSWLLRQKGKAIPRESDPEHIVGHDTTLIGWPWVSDTHSWLEPTALAILALRREGRGDHPRVREGVRLIADRAIVAGGWNYGNKAAFGHPLRPQPAPTGLALLALAPERDRSTVVAPAIRYLRATLAGTRAPASLGWGVLGLRAWGEEPPEAADWLAESAHQASGRPDAASRLAFLLLAGGDRALDLFAGDGRGQGGHRG